LGWHPEDDQEIFTLEQLVEAFSIGQISKSGARFDYEKAKWFNQKYIQAMDAATLATHIQPLAEAKGYQVSVDYLQQVAVLMKERVTFLPDFVEQGYYLFEPVRSYDSETVQKKWSETVAGIFVELQSSLGDIVPFESANLEEKVKQFVQEKGAKPGDVLPLLRIALAGTMKGPAVFDMAVALGSAETTTRLKRFVEIFNK
jgi:glutamyl-tRNA synthetase